MLKISLLTANKEKVKYMREGKSREFWKIYQKIMKIAEH